MTCTRWALAALLTTLGFGLLLNVEAQTIVGGKTAGAAGSSFKSSIAARAKVKEADVEKILKALGPIVSEHIRSGREVELPGVGTLRVVQVSEYKDLVNGRPAMMPAKNYVEFVPASRLNNDANAPGARPARTVEGYEFRINPNADPGIKTGYSRNPGTRTR